MSIKITVAMNTEGGQSGEKTVAPGTHHVAFFRTCLPGQDIANYTIRVNRVTVKADTPHVFTENDVITITPNKVAGQR